jgi:hypothetical protein
MFKKGAYFTNYGNYISSNYGCHSLCFTDAEGNDYYYSYQTLVAFRKFPGGLVVHENDWSSTTGKHLNWIDGGTPEAKKNRLSRDNFKQAYNLAFNVLEDLKQVL